MIELIGDFGGIQIDSTRSTRVISIDTKAVLNFYKGITLKKSRIRDNAAGLYSFAPTDGRGEARFASLVGPQHILKARSNGCVFNPKGKTVMRTEVIESKPVEYDGVLCPDFLWNGCLEALYGAGNAVKDIQGNPQVQAILAEALEKQFIALGNSIYDLTHFGQHPLIEDSDANGWYMNHTPTQEWADYTDQQKVIGGLKTIIDHFKYTVGREEYNVDIFNSEVDGKKFIGDPVDLFERAIEAAPFHMKQLAVRNDSMGRPLVIKVTRGIFKAYKDYLIDTYENIPESFYLRIKGLNGQYFTVPDVLQYDGKLVVPDDEQEIFDMTVGVITHRCMVVTPGMFGITYDVDPVSQFDGMGMQIVQKLDPEYKGKIFMTTTFRLGAGIVDPGFMTNASKVLLPDNQQ